MEAKRYAMVKDNIVYNVCLWDGNILRWQPPNDGTIMIANDWAGVGDWWKADEQTFYRALPNNEVALEVTEQTEITE
jgi:hypothetical protein